MLEQSCSTIKMDVPICDVDQTWLNLPVIDNYKAKWIATNHCQARNSKEVVQNWWKQFNFVKLIEQML